jgi:hypothetical protein
MDSEDTVRPEWGGSGLRGQRRLSDSAGISPRQAEPGDLGTKSG